LQKEDEKVKNSRFSKEQIMGILKQSEAGAKTSELCRQHGISAAMFYGWRSKYGGLEVREAKRLKQLEEENAKLKRIVADQALDITMLKDLVGKNGKPGGQEGGGRAFTTRVAADKIAVFPYTGTNALTDMQGVLTGMGNESGLRGIAQLLPRHLPERC
jgi:putative transposase